MTFKTNTPRSLAALAGMALALAATTAVASAQAIGEDPGLRETPRHRHAGPIGGGGFERGMRERGPRRGADEGRGQDLRAELKAQFDTNADGVLDESEREALRAHVRTQREQRRAEALERFDIDGDGELSPEERQAAHAAFANERGMRERHRGHEGRRGHGPRGERDGEQMRQRALSLFDHDGDGELSESEREEAKAFHEARKAEQRAKALERFDADGDGQLSREERRAARDAMRDKMQGKRAEALSEFDADGDGQLSETERQNARAAHKARRDAKLAQLRMDTNKDGVVDQADLPLALDRIARGAPTGDFNNDGVVDQNDADAVMKAIGN